MAVYLPSQAWLVVSLVVLLVGSPNGRSKLFGGGDGTESMLTRQFDKDKVTSSDASNATLVTPVAPYRTASDLRNDTQSVYQSDDHWPLNATRTLYVYIPGFGIGNTMNVLASGYVLARHTNRKLVYVDMTEGMRDYTVDVPHERILQANAPTNLFVVNEGNMRPAAGQRCLEYATNCNPYVEGEFVLEDMLKHKKLGIGATVYAFRPSGMSLIDYDRSMRYFMSRVHLTQEHEEQAQSKIRALREKARKVVGVHLRKTDNCFSTTKGKQQGACPDTEQFALTMDRELAADPEGVIFFLASDNPTASYELQALIPHAQIERHDFATASVDLRTLSLCDELIGTKYSTYSYVASRWRGIPLTEAGR